MAAKLAPPPGQSSTRPARSASVRANMAWYSVNERQLSRKSPMLRASDDRFTG
jgi:hypothetical protein